METNEPTHEMKDNHPIPTDINAKGYNLSGKIMLTAIILLFFIVLLMLCLHLYARWYLIHARRRALRRNLRRRRTQIVFYHDSLTNPSAVTRGLDAAVIASLPVFSYDPKTRPDNPAECAVCLSEFEAGETGRVLPKCNHTFHTDCIDVWFHSHATCPLCRAPVEPAAEGETRPEVVITVSEPETGSSSRLGNEENRTGRDVCLRKLSVEVPSRSGVSFRDESGCDSPSSTRSSSFRSPIGRMLSFKRMLSRERKGSVSPSSGGCSSAAELSNAERGETQGV